MIHNPTGGSTFVKNFDFSKTSETADELQTVVSEAKILASEMYNTNVYAIISDNAANMISMGKKIDEWHTIYHSHNGNLLLKDIVNKDVNEKIVNLIKLFKRPEFEQKILAVVGKKLRLLGDTRWCSYRDAYGLFLSNLTIMKHIAVDNEESSSHKITEEQRKTLSDEDFISTIRENIQIMDLVCKIVTVAQSTEEWLKLESKLSQEVVTKYQTQLSRRNEIALNTNVLTAIYLHLCYSTWVDWNENKKYDENAEDDTNDNALSQDRSTVTVAVRNRKKSLRRTVIDSLLENLCGNGLKSLAEFRQKTGIFRTLHDKKVTDMITYWDLASTYHPELSSFALKLLNLLASSAKLERLFLQ